jgi:hypothetical protein
MLATQHVAQTQLPPDRASLNEIVRAFQQTAPVDVVGLAKSLGLNVWELRDLPPNISGKIWKDPHGGISGFSIGVNASEAPVRKRFTVAHEIAHFVLHRNRFTNELLEDTMYRGSGMSSREEAQANKFAADVLMPFSLIQTLLKQGVHTVAEMAKQLEVSTTAMSIRLGVPTP